MDFMLGSSYDRLVENVRAFGEQYFSFDNVRQWRFDNGLPDDVVHDFVHLDFDGFAVIDKHGKESYDLLAQVLVIEELARISGATLPMANDFLNLQIMEEFADSDLFERVLDKYRCDGRLSFALAITEPEGGSDVMHMRTGVCMREGRLLLSGSKTFVNNGEYAPYLLVAAIDKDAEPGRRPALSMWLVPHDAPGINVYPIRKIGQSILPFSDVVFDEVELDETWRLNGCESGFPQLFHLLESGRLFVCATCLGLAQAAMEDAVSYAAQRRAFGEFVSDFQMIQQMIVEMQLKIENMRNSVYKSARMLEKDDPAIDARLSVALTKRYVPRTAVEVASDAMQILGGRGYSSGTRVSSIWKDCRGFQIAEGTDQIMVRIAAPIILDRYAPAEGTDSDL